MNDVNDIIGKILCKITDENDDLQLHLDDGEIVYFDAVGDCCSESWVEHIDTPSKPEKIIQIQELEISNYNYEATEYKKRKKEDIDVLSAYFYQINTDGGSYLIELRNNSNGYYGGWLQRDLRYKDKSKKEIK